MLVLLLWIHALLLSLHWHLMHLLTLVTNIREILVGRIDLLLCTLLDQRLSALRCNRLILIEC